jgi:hypothetical protein
VHTWWDIGVNDTTAIWFVQRVGHWIHAIDYLEDTGQGIDYFAKRLKELPYNYGQHIGPHDLRVREWGANGATKRLDAARTLGLNFIVAPNIPRQDGIDAVRRSIPRFRFEKTKCQRGVYALQSYHKEWDDEKKCYRDSPHHDWASNGADAFRMGIVGWDADSDDRRRDEPTEMKFDPYRARAADPAGHPRVQRLHGRVAMGMGKKKGLGKVDKVMHEFGEGKLHSGSKHGPQVTSRKQAIAIAMSEAGMSKKRKKK